MMHPILQRLEQLPEELGRRDQAVKDAASELTRRIDQEAGTPFAQLKQLPEIMLEVRRKLGTSPAERERGQLLEDLCRAYLSATPKERGEIRNFFKDASRIGFLIALGGFMATGTRMIRTAEDAPWLTLGLAAASIDDATLDYRDLSLSLGELKVAAVRAGIDPAPVIREVAEISSRGRTGTCPGSMRGFLRTWADALDSEKTDVSMRGQ